MHRDLRVSICISNKKSKFRNKILVHKILVHTTFHKNGNDYVVFVKANLTIVFGSTGFYDPVLPVSCLSVDPGPMMGRGMIRRTGVFQRGAKRNPPTNTKEEVMRRCAHLNTR